MGRALRLPGLADILFVDRAAEIRPLALDRRIDRGFRPGGPLLNRLLVGRLRAALTFDSGPLPSIAPRDDDEREAGQRTLERRLDPAVNPSIWDAQTIGMLGDAVRGAAGAPPLGAAAQQAIGRLFVADYAASRASWAAARWLNDAVQTRNPLRSLFLRLSGRLPRSKRLLYDRVRGDRAGVHATGIAVHNLVRSFEIMRDLWREPGVRQRLSAEAVVARCLVAPPTLLRQATEHGDAAAGRIRPRTLIVIQLDRIRRRSPSPQTAFMDGTWSRCPAAQSLPLLLRAVWERANADAEKETRP
jgi:hypothetical protein